MKNKFRKPISHSLRRKIAERDGWICQICGRAVNPSLRFPHPDSASIDHILPVSCGGTNDPANLRLAHLHCNISRGNRINQKARRRRRAGPLGPFKPGREDALIDSVFYRALETKRKTALGFLALFGMVPGRPRTPEVAFWEEFGP